MNDIRPAIGIEFQDKYLQAKNKLIEFIMALENLNPAEKDQLAREMLMSASMASTLEQFAALMRNGKGYT